jgi:hypothetical protein
MASGKVWNGLAALPKSRRTCAHRSESITVKSSPNFSAISSRHFTVSPAGQTIMIRRARARSSSSWATSPASIVLPRPTSSANSRFTRGAPTARATGSSW